MGAWRCLDCSAPLDNEYGTCSHCEGKLERQRAEAPDPWEVAGGLDLTELGEDDEYRRSKGRNRGRG